MWIHHFLLFYNFSFVPIVPFSFLSEGIEPIAIYAIKYTLDVLDSLSVIEFSEMERSELHSHGGYHIGEIGRLPFSS